MTDEHPVPATEWEGLHGFVRFAGDGRFAVPDPRAFRATCRHLVLEDLQVAEWSTSPLSGSSPARRDAVTVTLLSVDEGSVRYWTDDSDETAASGSVHLISDADAMRFSVPEPSRFTLISTVAASLPPELRPSVSLSVGRVPTTRITTGLTALAQQVLDPTVGGAGTPAARALRAVAVAAMEDSTREADGHDLRARIVGHVARHISDPDLGPRSIAAEFGISLRWVHHVFDVDGASLARHIRELRLELVAARLLESDRFPRIGALAERSGFGSRDQLARAFKSRYGVTLAEYAMRGDSAVRPATGGADAPDRD